MAMRKIEVPGSPAIIEYQGRGDPALSGDRLSHVDQNYIRPDTQAAANGGNCGPEETPLPGPIVERLRNGLGTPSGRTDEPHERTLRLDDKETRVKIMRVLRAAGTFAAAAVLAAAVASPASADAAGGPGAVLTLSWSSPSMSSQVFTTRLACQPAGGGDEWYLDPDLACGDLAVAGGNFEALPGRGLSCERVPSRPVQFTATGHWFGQPVRYEEVHANWCEARKKLGWVATF
jgi:hypothetical protein